MDRLIGGWMDRLLDRYRQIGGWTDGWIGRQIDKNTKIVDIHEQSDSLKWKADRILQ